MCSGIALLESELPTILVESHLTNRLYVRNESVREIRFFWREPEAILPVLVDGQIELVRWGNKQRKSPLPITGWTWEESIEAGKWAAMEPTLVTIIASAGYEKGVWFPIRQGIRGILVYDEQRVPHVYMLCQQPTRYYQVMTRADREPVLVEESI